ncbi:MAG: sigma-70 family RNA polymerase sigma factor [Firmicutes bacterium]|nr:sigma-70 family RNA polymerase sigma factor [Bacillota bacterium]
MKKQPLKKLITDAQQGDAGALARLCEQTRPQLYVYALYLTHDRELSQELVQETYVRIIESIGDLRDPDRFFPWAKKILFHLLPAGSAGSPRALTAADGLLSSLADEDDLYLPDTAIDRQQQQAIVAEILEELPPKHREILIACYYEERSLSEIASLFGCPEGTVKSRLYHARQAFRRKLAAYERRHRVDLQKLGRLLGEDPIVTGSLLGKAALRSAAQAGQSGAGLGRLGLGRLGLGRPDFGRPGMDQPGMDTLGRGQLIQAGLRSAAHKEGGAFGRALTAVLMSLAVIGFTGTAILTGSDAPPDPLQSASLQQASVSLPETGRGGVPSGSLAADHAAVSGVAAATSDNAGAASDNAGATSDNAGAGAGNNAGTGNNAGATQQNQPLQANPLRTSDGNAAAPRRGDSRRPGRGSGKKPGNPGSGKPAKPDPANETTPSQPSDSNAPVTPASSASEQILTLSVEPSTLTSSLLAWDNPPSAGTGISEYRLYRGIAQQQPDLTRLSRKAAVSAEELAAQVDGLVQIASVSPQQNFYADTSAVAGAWNVYLLEGWGETDSGRQRLTRALQYGYNGAAPPVPSVDATGWASEGAIYILDNNSTGDAVSLGSSGLEIARRGGATAGSGVGVGDAAASGDSNAAGGDFETIARLDYRRGSSNAYMDRDVLPGVTYYYRLRTWCLVDGAKVYSPWSTPVRARLK